MLLLCGWWRQSAVGFGGLINFIWIYPNDQSSNSNIKTMEGKMRLLFAVKKLTNIIWRCLIGVVAISSRKQNKKNLDFLLFTGALISNLVDGHLKYYSPTVKDGKTFFLVFCVLWITVYSLSTRCKILGRMFCHLQRSVNSTLALPT